MEKSVEDILMSALVTRDGLIMASTESDRVKNETLAAYGAVVFNRADETMQLFSNDTINLLVFDGKENRVMAIRAGEAILIVLAGKNAPAGLLLHEVQNTAGKLAELM
ncbi:MAG: roadblock/LC7 domain-containing protein [Candidatus Methanoperedens sp.]|nr:roadblock/LC7 domain-containing protein [Candidatus Methanoperedens sp.]